MLRRCPKCRKDGGLVYCPVCHGVKRYGEVDLLRERVKELEAKIEQLEDELSFFIKG